MSATLAVGENVCYRGIGPGTVTEHVVRPFQGKETTFASIAFAHVEMKAQIPIEDAAIQEKVRPVISAHKAKQLMKELQEPGTYLARTWDRREEMARTALGSTDVANWVQLLRDFATTEQQGISLAISDINVIDRATKMIAAEVACATNTEYRLRWREIQETYVAMATVSTTVLADA